MAARRFALIDRDGTIIALEHYLSDPDAVVLLPGAAAGLRRIQALGLGLVVLTNQSAIGRGYFDHARLEEIHARFRALLRAEGVELDGIYHCPHHPDDDCGCRKPRPGMAEQAAREHGFDPAESFVIGDMTGDVGLGLGLGATTILVRTGYGTRVEREGEVHPDLVVDDLAAAADTIAQQLNRGRA